MVSATPQPRLIGVAPVLAEHRIEVVAAVGRLDVDEVGALRAQLHPVDVTLPARDIDTVHGQMLGRALAEVDRLGVTKAPFVDDAVTDAARPRGWSDRNKARRHRALRLHQSSRLRSREIVGRRRNGLSSGVRFLHGSGGARDGAGRLQRRARHHILKASARRAAGGNQTKKQRCENARRTHLDPVRRTKQTDGDMPAGDRSFMNDKLPRKIESKS